MPALYLVIVSALVALIAYRTYGLWQWSRVARGRWADSDSGPRPTSPDAAES